jgi:hypothetical protein
MIKGDGFVSVKIYAAIYVKGKKDKIKEDLKAYFSRENIIAEKIFRSFESVHMHIRVGSEENLYHLHLEVQEDESERAQTLLYDWLNKNNGVQIHIAPCIEQ